jgi:pyridoxamine 5'-phosphate oxidase
VTPDSPLSALRRDYAQSALSEDDVDRDPIQQFKRWFADAQEAKLSDVNAMTLATSTADGVPSARVVLLKAVDARGFVFFTDYRSRKGRELEKNPRAALVFYWPRLERQVRVTGTTHRVTTDESATYFASRPLESRLSASASHQSAVIPSRAVLEARVTELAHQYHESNPPPLPAYWGGFRVAHETVEFWQGRSNRLHDRLLYTRAAADNWHIQRLSP